RRIRKSRSASLYTPTNNALAARKRERWRTAVCIGRNQGESRFGSGDFAKDQLSDFVDGVGCGGRKVPAQEVVRRAPGPLSGAPLERPQTCGDLLRCLEEAENTGSLLEDRPRDQGPKREHRHPELDRIDKRGRVGSDQDIADAEQGVNVPVVGNADLSLVDVLGVELVVDEVLEWIRLDQQGVVGGRSENGGDQLDDPSCLTGALRGQ